MPDWKDRNVFVRELPQEFTEDNVRTLFSNCGEIESVRLKTQTSFILKDSGFT